MVNNLEYGEGYANEDDNRVKRLSELKKGQIIFKLFYYKFLLDLWDRREVELDDVRIDANEEE